MLNILIIIPMLVMNCQFQFMGLKNINYKSYTNSFKSESTINI